MNEIKLEPWKPDLKRRWYNSADLCDAKELYNDFDFHIDAIICATRELATRKLYRYADLLNPPDDGKTHPMYTMRLAPIDAVEKYEVRLWTFDTIEVPFHSRESCERAWMELTDEERESLFWRSRKMETVNDDIKSEV